jgi:hypothetical protein
LLEIVEFNPAFINESSSLAGEMKKYRVAFIACSETSELANWWRAMSRSFSPAGFLFSIWRNA